MPHSDPLTGGKRPNMKKKIGFIDLHIDEWHANHYPEWFRAAKSFADFELGYAWEESPDPDGRPLDKWCKDYGMNPALNIEEVIEKSDAICILAPSNPEAHERLAALPLKSGKPLYIDKTFAPDRATAEKFFAVAEKYGTPLMSSSALRYGNEFQAELAGKFAEKKVNFVSTIGGGRTFHEYSIHQIEMIVAALGIGAKSVMRIPNCKTEHFLVEYADAVRGATMTYQPNTGFSSILYGPEGVSFVTEGTSMFENLLELMLQFYQSGVSPLDKLQTIEVAAIREAALKAEKEPGKAFPL